MNNSVNSFVQLIQDAAEPLFRKTFSGDSKSKFKNTLSKPAEWFDNECYEAKRTYTNSLKQYNTCKTPDNRQTFCRDKQSYKKLIKRKRRPFELKRIKAIENLRHSKPKDFWNLFKRKNTNSSNIKVDAFYKFFSELSNYVNHAPDHAHGETSEQFCRTHNFDNVNSNFPELDKEITITEVTVAIKGLKRNKAAGSDCIVNEYFIESCDILAICLMQYKILVGFQISGRRGLKYRFLKRENRIMSIIIGVLVSCLSKVFTSILNKRINDWVEANDIISDSQFGFRKGRSTTDAIFFLLQSLKQKTLNQNERLYCAFVDLKAFDSVYRNGV